MYRILLKNDEIGTTALEFGDPPMGIASGKISFHIPASPFRFLLDHCQTHGITVNGVDPELELIDTSAIPDLRVLRIDGVEIPNQGCCINGFKDDGYEITILFIPYPLYAEEFPHHRQAYDEQFKA